MTHTVRDGNVSRGHGMGCYFAQNSAVGCGLQVEHSIKEMAGENGMTHECNVLCAFRSILSS